MGDAVYPRGQIAEGSGDLLDVTNIKVSTTNNAKQVHTIRKRGAGITLGVEESTVTFEMAIGEDGQERDYFNKIKKGRVQQLRVKIPGETLTFTGAFNTRDLEAPLDAEINMTMTFVGHLTD